MENKNGKIVWVIVGLAVIALIIIFVIRGSSMKSSSVVAPETGTETAPVSSATTEPESTLDASGTVQPQAASISYTDALVKYKDRRIQFDKTCQAFPNTITYNDNLGIMIDNRSPSTRTIKVGSVYTIKAYGFKIVMLPDVYMKAKTLLVDCDTRQNVATILVQN